MPYTRNKSKTTAVIPPSADIFDYSDCSDPGENWQNTHDDDYFNSNWCVEESDSESDSELEESFEVNKQSRRQKTNKSKGKSAPKRDWKKEDLSTINRIFIPLQNHSQEDELLDVPLKYFLKFFNYEIIDLIVFQSNLYHTQKKGT